MRSSFHRTARNSQSGVMWVCGCTMWQQVKSSPYLGARADSLLFSPDGRFLANGGERSDVGESPVVGDRYWTRSRIP